MAPQNSKQLSLAVQYACDDRELPSRAQIRRLAAAAAERDARVTVRFVDVAEGQALNRDFRGKNYATNVLSFPYEDSPVVGDVVICAPVIRREAKDQGKPLAAHFAHMIVHGMLHLQGYDHEAGEQEAKIMEMKERALLARFRIADPYLP